MPTDLFSPDDPDWADFRGRNQEYLLRVAGSFLQEYLGWHLAPSITETCRVPVGQRGIIMLPSRRVSTVTSVVINEEVTLEPDDYILETGGWIETRRAFFDTWPGRAVVTMDHGFEECPLEVKQVAYELVASLLDTPAGNVSQLSTPAGYRVSLSLPAGFNLNPGQVQLLAGYKLFGPT